MRRALVLALALAACGDEPPTAQDASTSATDATTTSADAGARDAARDLDAMASMDAQLLDANDGGSDDAGAQDAASHRVAFTSTRRSAGNVYHLFVMRDDGSALEQLTEGAGSNLAPSWSPDGERLVFSSSRSGRFGIYVMDVPTKTVDLVTLELPVAQNPVFSPDGRTIAFQGRVSAQRGFDIYVVTSTGGPARQLTEAVENDVGPAWSPDGQLIYFVSNRGGTHEVFVMDASGDGERAVTRGAQIVGRPVVAPDGRSLLFGAGSETTHVVRYDLMSARTSTISDKDDSEPSLSADGRVLVYSTAQFGTSDIMIRDLTSGRTARLTDDPGIDGSPAIAP